MIANPEGVEAPGQLADDVAQLVAAGMSADEAAAAIAATDILAEQLARRSAELLAELVGPGMVSGSLPAWVGDVLAESYHSMWYTPPQQLGAAHHVMQFAYEPRPEARELVLTLQLDGSRIWTGVLKADRAS